MPPKGIRWEFRTDEGKFKAFDARHNTAVEDAFQSGADSFDMKVGSQDYRIDLKMLVQRNTSTKKERLIRRVAPSGEVTARIPVWEWKAKGDAWAEYSKEHSALIEAAFAKDALKITIKGVATSAHDMCDAVIHFGHMAQTTEKNPDKHRPIRRVLKTTTTSLPSTQEDIPKAKKVEKKAETPAPVVGGVRGAKRPRADEEETAGGSSGAAAHNPPQGPTEPIITGTAATPVAVSVNEKSWDFHENSVLLLQGHKSHGPTATVKVASFDMDDTLVKPTKGKTFAKGRADWEWLCPAVVPKLKAFHEGGYHIIIISNQNGLDGKPDRVRETTGKVLDLAKAAGIPISAALAVKKDKYRKPEPELWKLALNKLLHGAQVDMKASFYCGDAGGRHIYTLAGRAKDFSCGDRKFAYNVGLPFSTPEEFFEGKAPVKDFSWDGPGPQDLAKLPTSYPLTEYHSKKGPEMVICVGFPGCGKSSFYGRFLGPHNYVQANRDTLKTKEKCVLVAKEALKSGKSVVIDNTNPSKEDRKMFLDVAKAAGVQCRCFEFTATKPLAMHWNAVRMRNGGAHVPGIAYNMFSSKYVKPSSSEGFAEVHEIPPVVNFTGLPASVKETFFLLS